jgi:hypothetical protein
MPADRLPDDIERELTLVHADVCQCVKDMIGAECYDVRALLRRAIGAGMLEQRAEAYDDSGLHHGCADCRNAREKLRARAAALRSEKP